MSLLATAWCWQVLLGLLLLCTTAVDAHNSNPHNHHLNLSIGLIVRTYHGDQNRCQTSLIPSLNAFVDRTNIHIQFVLDAEDPVDEMYGQTLQRQGFHVMYEFLPGYVNTSTIPFFEPGKKEQYRYGTIGYTRQLFSTYYFDLYMKTDIIGIVDCDNLLTTMLTLRDVVDLDKRIYASAMQGNHYRDSEVLNATVDYDFMYTDVMPKFIFRDTFFSVRQHLLKVYNVQTFAEVWGIIGKLNHSPANVLLGYGVMFDPSRYHLVLSGDDRGMVMLGSNRPRPRFAVMGCCNMFPHDIACPYPNYKTAIDHLFFVNNVYLDRSYPRHSNPKFQFNKELHDEHYARVNETLSTMQPMQRNSMLRHCEKIVTTMRERK